MVVAAVFGEHRDYPSMHSAVSGKRARMFGCRERIGFPAHEHVSPHSPSRPAPARASHLGPRSSSPDSMPTALIFCGACRRGTVSSIQWILSYITRLCTFRMHGRCVPGRRRRARCLPRLDRGGRPRPAAPSARRGAAAILLVRPSDRKKFPCNLSSPGALGMRHPGIQSVLASGSRGLHSLPH